MTKLFNVRMDEALIERLRAHSKETGIPQSRLVRDALEGALPSSERRAPEKTAGTPRPSDFSGAKPASGPFRCPTPGCSFTAGSAQAVCPFHARKVVR